MTVLKYKIFVKNAKIKWQFYLLFIDAIYTESCRQDCNCASGKILPLHGGKTEQTIERTYPGASLVAEM